MLEKLLNLNAQESLHLWTCHPFFFSQAVVDKIEEFNIFWLQLNYSFTSRKDCCWLLLRQSGLKKKIAAKIWKRGYQTTGQNFWAKCLKKPKIFPIWSIETNMQPFLSLPQTYQVKPKTNRNFPDNYFHDYNFLAIQNVYFINAYDDI